MTEDNSELTLEYVSLADKSQLAALIARAEEIIEDSARYATANDAGEPNRYWTAFNDALTAAKNLPQDAGQADLDAAAAALAEAMASLQYKPTISIRVVKQITRDFDGNIIEEIIPAGQTVNGMAGDEFVLEATVTDSVLEHVYEGINWSYDCRTVVKQPFKEVVIDGTADRVSFIPDYDELIPINSTNNIREARVIARYYDEATGITASVTSQNCKTLLQFWQYTPKLRIKPKLFTGYTIQGSLQQKVDEANTLTITAVVSKNAANCTFSLGNNIVIGPITDFADNPSDSKTKLCTGELLISPDTWPAIKAGVHTVGIIVDGLIYKNIPYYITDAAGVEFTAVPDNSPQNPLSCREPFMVTAAVTDVLGNPITSGIDWYYKIGSPDAGETVELETDGSNSITIDPAELTGFDAAKGLFDLYLFAEYRDELSKRIVIDRDSEGNEIYLAYPEEQGLGVACRNLWLDGIAGVQLDADKGNNLVENKLGITVAASPQVADGTPVYAYLVDARGDMVKDQSGAEIRAAEGTVTDGTAGLELLIPAETPSSGQECYYIKIKIGQYAGIYAEYRLLDGAALEPQASITSIVHNGAEYRPAEELIALGSSITAEAEILNSLEESVTEDDGITWYYTIGSVDGERVDLDGNSSRISFVPEKMGELADGKGAFTIYLHVSYTDVSGKEVLAEPRELAINCIKQFSMFSELGSSDLQQKLPFLLILDSQVGTGLPFKLSLLDGDGNIVQGRSGEEIIMSGSIEIVTGVRDEDFTGYFGKIEIPLGVTPGSYNFQVTVGEDGRAVSCAAEKFKVYSDSEALMAVVIESVAKKYQSQVKTRSFLREWQVIGLSWAGYDINGSEWTYGNGSNYVATLASKAQVTGGSAWNFLVKDIMSVVCAGYNPRDFAGTDLVKPLVAMIKDDGAFAGGINFDTLEPWGNTAINGQVWGIIALNTAGADERDGLTREKLEKALQPLLNPGHVDSFGYGVDMNGMALTALGPYRGKGIAGVDEAIEKYINLIKAEQLKHGGFYAFGLKPDPEAAFLPLNPESTAAVVQGLVSCGINPLTDPAWQKDGGNMMTALLMAYSSKGDQGGFAHGYRYKDWDVMATEQCLYALADLYQGKSVYANINKPTRDLPGYYIEDAKQLLRTVVHTVKSRTGKNYDYTAESWAVFRAALSDAESVLEAPDAEIEAIIAARVALLDAFNNLLVIPEGRTVVSIELTNYPDKLEYRVGEAFDCRGLLITATYDDGLTGKLIITPDMVSGFDSSKEAARQEVRITYDAEQEQYVTFYVTILPAGGGDIPDPAGRDITVRMRIEGYKGTHMDGSVTFNPEDYKDEDGKYRFTGPDGTEYVNDRATVLLATVMAWNQNGITDNSVGYSDNYVARMAGEEEFDFLGEHKTSGWLVRVNNKLINQGVGVWPVEDWDEIEWYYGDVNSYFGSMEVTPTSLKTGEQLKVKVFGRSNGGMSMSNTSRKEPMEEAAVYVGSEEYTTGANGEVEITMNNPGTFEVYAVKLDKDASNGGCYFPLMSRTEKVRVKVTGESIETAVPVPEDPADAARIIKEVLDNPEADENLVAETVKAAATCLVNSLKEIKTADEANQLLKDTAAVTQLLNRAAGLINSSGSALDFSRSCRGITGVLAGLAPQISGEESKATLARAAVQTFEAAAGLLDCISDRGGLRETVDGLLDSAAPILASLQDQDAAAVQNSVLSLVRQAARCLMQETLGADRLIIQDAVLKAAIDPGQAGELAGYAGQTVAGLEEKLNQMGLGQDLKLARQAIINIPGQSEKAVQVTLSAGTMAEVAAKGADSLLINTAEATFNLPPDVFGQASQDKNLTLSAALVDPADLNNPAVPSGSIVVDLNAAAAGQAIIAFSTPLEVCLPYPGTPADPAAVTVYQIKADGSLEPMGGTYDPASGRVIFQTRHFSKYFAQEAPKQQFTDLKDYAWAQEAIETLAGKGIISGKGDGIFDPGANVTRAEFASLITRMLNQKAPQSASLPFKDVAQDSWYYDAVAAAYAGGLVSGCSQDRFNPGNSISREEMAVIIARVLEQKGYADGRAEDLAGFKDRDRIASWAQDGAALAVREGIIGGMGDGRVAPADNTNRAQTAVMLYRLYGILTV